MNGNLLFKSISQLPRSIHYFIGALVLGTLSYLAYKVFTLTHSFFKIDRLQISESLQNITSFIDENVFNEYRELNLGNDNLDKLRKKLIYIETLKISNVISEDNINSLALTEDEKTTCNTLFDISNKLNELKGFHARTNQLLSVLLFLEGNTTSLAQIRTGQGKTLIAAMTAIARHHIYKENVAILTTTEPLAISGVNEME